MVFFVSAYVIFAVSLSYAPMSVTNRYKFQRIKVRVSKLFKCKKLVSYNPNICMIIDNIKSYKIGLWFI